MFALSYPNVVNRVLKLVQMINARDNSVRSDDLDP